MSINNSYFLNPAHLELAKARYFLKDENGNLVENDIEEVFNRVVNHIYSNEQDPKHKEEALKYRLEKKIIDAGRILAQAGTSTKNLYNCFVLSFGDDTREAISELKRKHFSIQAQGGGCIDGNTYIYTKECGIIKIKDIPDFKDINEFGVPHKINGYGTISYSKLMNVFQNDKITDLWKFKVPAKDVRIMEFQSGSVKTSVWHPFITVSKKNDKYITEEKRADQIKSGESILVLSPHSLFSNDNDEFSWLLGYIVGDGNISKNKLGHDRIRVWDQNPTILQRVVDILKKYDCFREISKVNGENCYEIGLTSAIGSNHGNSNPKMRELFDHILYFFDGTKKSFKIERMKDIPSISAFIAGIVDSDGYIGKEKTSVSMCMKEFIYALQRHIALLGIKSHIRVRTPSRARDVSIMYEITYANCWNRLFPTVKQSRLPKADHYNSKFEIVKNISIGERDEEFYDFSVEKNNNYIAFNGNAFIVVHNTGINFSTLRPNGSICKSTQSRSSGAVGFITDFSYQSSNISQGGNRSGANLGTLEDHHPDLYEFITKKSTSNWENIRKFSSVYNEDEFSYFQWNHPHMWQMFNVSVFISDEFMEKVISDSDDPWVLKWKDEEWHLWDFINTVGPKTGQKYSRKITVVALNESMARYKASSQIPYFNSSNLVLENGPYDLTVKEWFGLVCKNAWEDGCPGIIFSGLARRFHNGEYFNKIVAANPCSEQIMPTNSVCCLTSLVLPSFFKDGEFDYPDFKNAIWQSIRGLDNIIDLSKTGESDIDSNSLRERRIGLGTTGIAELLILKKVKYSSDTGRRFVGEILEFMRNEAYKASISLAKERGSFPAFEYDGFSGSEFFKTLPEDIRNAVREFGIRNVTILTQQPTGTTGTMVGYSQGCEPYFLMCFSRNSRVGTFQDGSPAFIQWLKDSEVEYSKYDHNLQKLRDKTKVPKYFEESLEISPLDHLKMQAMFAKYIDSAVSKTINLPSDATIEDVENAYVQAYKMGIKSTTVYRYGSKEQVLEHVKKEEKDSKPVSIVDAHSPDRPDALECDIHHTSVKGEKWTVLVGLLHGKPYELFCAPQDAFEISEKYDKARIVKDGKMFYLETDDFKLKNISGYLKTDEHRVITRLISTCLRYGVPTSFISEQLAKADGTIVDFSKAMLRVLRKYDSINVNIKDSVHTCSKCGSTNIIINGGCPECLDCGTSKCG